MVVVNPWILVMAGVLANSDDGVLWLCCIDGSECWLDSLPAGLMGCCGCGESMDPSSGWSSCKQGFWGALAVVH